MTILLPDTATEQTINYIPFVPATITKIEFLDEQQNVTSEAVLGSQNKVSFYWTIGVTIDLKEGSIYMMYFYNGTDVVYRDKCFSTSQPVTTYSVNNGVYTNAPSTPNKYIIYGQ